MKLAFLCVALSMFRFALAADKSSSNLHEREDAPCQAIFVGIKSGSLVADIIPALGATKAGRAYLRRCLDATNKSSSSKEVQAMRAVVEYAKKDLLTSYPNDLNATNLAKRFEDSFAYTIVDTSTGTPFDSVQQKRKSRQSACQKFNDFVSRVFDRLNS